MTILDTSAQRDSTLPVSAVLPLQRVREAATAAAPPRSPELAHLTLGRLRSYRQSLLVEEVQVSYWRRIVQARRDLLRAGNSPDDRVAIAAVLGEDRPRDGRRMILTLHPDVGVPMLPHLPELWHAMTDADDVEASDELFLRLGEAESALSSYRETLHRRLDRATADLIARYHDEPRLCLIALPFAPDPLAA